MMTELEKQLKAWEAIVAACLRDGDQTAYLERARRSADHFRRAIARE